MKREMKKGSKKFKNFSRPSKIDYLPSWEGGQN